MRKTFGVRRLLKVYLEQDHSTKLAEVAKANGKAVSEYVRELILDDIQATVRFEEVCDRTETITEKAAALPESSALAKAAKRSLVKTCRHGTEKGWRCWQCKGIAVIE